jgi:hypothetical protein
MRSAEGPSPLASARHAYSALNRSFGAGHGLFDKHADGPAYAGAWAVAQAMDGATGLAKLPRGWVGSRRIGAFFRNLQRYWDGSGPTPGYEKALKPPLGPGGYKFYDDNALVGLALIRGYLVTQDPAMLDRAGRVFAFETHGWDRKQSDAFPGGVFWTQAPGSPARNTVSTAGAAELGLQLYLLTGKQDDLRWATRMYDWVNSTLRAPDGLYWDRVYPNGAIKRPKWSYNQGLMLGTNELLYRATGDRSFLRQAVRIGNLALSHYRHGRGFAKQRPILDAIFFQNLLALDQLQPNPSYLRAAKGYARYLAQHLDPRTGVLEVTPRPELLDQAALVQVNAYIALTERGIPVG